MHLVHIKKTKGSDATITVDATLATQSTAFATYLTKTKAGAQHDAFGWRLVSTMTEGQYVGHKFELLMTPAELDAFIAAATEARARFQEDPNVVAVPVTEGVAAEGDDEE